MKKIAKLVAELWRDEEGASAAEYALILAIVTTGIAGAAVALGDAIGNAIGDATDCIEDAVANCSTP
jgi:pilus assembly protein Flp/PilA